MEQMLLYLKEVFGEMLEEKKKKDFVKKPSEFFKYLIN
jgi:hypothetical protein